MTLFAPFILPRYRRSMLTIQSTLSIFFFYLVSFNFYPAQAAELRAVKSMLEMRQENVVVQKWDLSCGTAALATLLNYQYGDLVSEREIAKALINRKEYLENPDLIKVREGFSLLDLKRFVDARSYEGIGYGKMTMEDLIEQAPIMVPIRTNGYNHFVIFRGVWKNRVLLADPAWGNRTLLVEQFEDNWIEFPKVGKVGFIIKANDPDILSENRLSPRPDEFLTLR